MNQGDLRSATLRSCAWPHKRSRGVKANIKETHKCLIYINTSHIFSISGKMIDIKET